MNEVREDYRHLKPIDIDAIYLESEQEEQKPATPPAYGNSYRKSRRNEDELNRDAWLGMSQVYMNNYNRPLSEAQKRYIELCEVPIDELYKKDEEELEQIDDIEDYQYSNNGIFDFNLNDEPLEESQSNIFAAQPSNNDYVDFKEEYSNDTGNNNFFSASNENIFKHKQVA